MVDLIERKERKARKSHECCYCGGTIEKGEKYDWSKLIYDGQFYEWSCHLSCSRVASAIWDYVDPDEGMSSDNFHEGCYEVCRAFVCTGCENWNKELEYCENDISYCIDKMDEFFKTNEIYCAGREGFAHIWKCRKSRRRMQNEPNIPPQKS